MSRAQKTLFITIPGWEFDAMRKGELKELYFRMNRRWHSKLHGRHYDWLHITRGVYMVGGEPETVRIPFDPVETREMIHPPFGPEKQRLFVLKLSIQAVRF